MGRRHRIEEYIHDTHDSTRAPRGSSRSRVNDQKPGGLPHHFVRQTWSNGRFHAMTKAECMWEVQQNGWHDCFVIQESLASLSNVLKVPASSELCQGNPYLVIHLSISFFFNSRRSWLLNLLCLTRLVPQEDFCIGVKNSGCSVDSNNALVLIPSQVPFTRTGET